MARPNLPLRQYRLLVRASLVLSVGATVAGLYAFLQGLWGYGLVGVGAGILLLYPSQYYQIRPEAGSELVLVFVTKRHCSLCEEARALLPGILEGTPFRVEEAAIEDHRLLRRHFKGDVPVLLWQGEVVARLQWDAAAIRARLGALEVSRAASGPPPRQQSP